MTVNGAHASVRTYAKINLTLDVLSKRADGYHDIRSIMQTVSLSDNISVDMEHHGISIYSNARYVPCDRRSIAYRIAEEFFAYTGIKGGARIGLYKNIPVSAGLAGGSGDGAAVLTALDTLYGTYLPDEELFAIGAKVGADIPYCINGGTQLAEGIGDILTPLAPAPVMDILLVKPLQGVSTAEVYSELDSASDIVRPDTEGMIASLESGNKEEAARRLCNVMETVTVKRAPQLDGIKRKMIKDGALGAVMSGSGPTVFGIFPDARTAKKCADSFFYQFSATYLVRTI